MTRQIKGLLYFFVTDFRYSIIIFWSIVIAVLVVSLVASTLLLDLDEAIFVFGFPFATYIHAGRFGFIAVKEAIPFSLKMGATRKNIYVAIGVFFLGLALFQAVISNVLQAVGEWVVDGADIHVFHFTHLGDLLESTNWLTNVLIDTVCIFLLFSFFFLIGLLFYRGGLKVGGSVVGILSIVLLFDIALGWTRDSFNELIQNMNVSIFGQLFVIAIVLYGLSYFLLRRITTVKVR